MKTAFTVLALTVLLTSCSTKSSAQEALSLSQEDDKTRCVGTWQRESGDASAYQKVTLTLRADGTYSKTLDARVGGQKYGGTHEGTWKARGLIVDLSGDGNWPPSSHDLSQFTKID